MTERQTGWRALVADYRAWFLISILLLGGVASLWQASAATTAVAAEAEAGARAGNATVVSGSNASGAAGGAALRFGSAISPGDRFGMSLGGSYQYLDAAELGGRLDDMQTMGVEWVRFDFTWADIQSGGSGSYNWTRYDNLVAATRQRNLKILGILAYAPQWAQQAGCAGQFACPPNGTAAYAAFAAATASRYATRGVTHWEIWNEPNIPNFWINPSAEDYTALLRAAYTAIKQASPGAVVITGGTAPTGAASNRITQLEFVKRMYVAGAARYFDALGHHPYCYSGGAQCIFNGGNAWTEMSQTNENLRSIMTANGDTAKQIWLTEYGAPTGGDPSSQVTEVGQGQMVTDAYRTAATYPWAGPLFWYTYKDNGNSNSTVEDWFGVVGYNGNQKPSYQAYRSLTGK